MELHLPNFCFFLSIKFNAKNIIFNQTPIITNKMNSNSGKIVKTIIMNIARTIFFSIFIFNKSYVS